MEHISFNDLDSAEDLLTEGEVVRVRVLYHNGAVVLSMLDVDDDEPAVPTPPLLRGGPPWLDLERPYASIFANRSPFPPQPRKPGRRRGIRTLRRRTCTARIPTHPCCAADSAANYADAVGIGPPHH
ncbi:hypothetical protein NHF46_02615 [Arthrobacter alpinus]|nr:hypothetical protein [Arthrobacter alpinus]